MLLSANDGLLSEVSKEAPDRGDPAHEGSGTCVEFSVSTFLSTFIRDCDLVLSEVPEQEKAVVQCKLDTP